jgi:RNA-binding protein
MQVVFQGCSSGYNSRTHPETQMPLSKQDMQHFKAIGHHLKPVLQLGDKGLSDRLIEELNLRLEDHELIKVKVAGRDRDDRDSIILELCQKTGAALIQRIGNIALLHRSAVKPNPKLSNLLRPRQ